MSGQTTPSRTSASCRSSRRRLRHRGAEYRVRANTWDTHGIGVGDVNERRAQRRRRELRRQPAELVHRGASRRPPSGTLAGRSSTRATTSPSRSTLPTSTSTAAPTSSRSTAAGTRRASTCQQLDGTLGDGAAVRASRTRSHYNPHGLAVGDVNGDGSPDVVLADYNNGLVVLRNTTAADERAARADAEGGGRRLPAASASRGRAAVDRRLPERLPGLPREHERRRDAARARSGPRPRSRIRPRRRERPTTTR